MSNKLTRKLVNYLFRVALLYRNTSAPTQSLLSAVALLKRAQFLLLRSVMHRNIRFFQLLHIFTTSLRIFGLYPFGQDAHTKLPTTSWKWRVYSAFLITCFTLTFAAFCVYSMKIHLERRTEDELMDFVRISEVLIITVMLFSIGVTEQCFYGSLAQILIQLHVALRDIFDDFSMDSSSSKVYAAILTDWHRNRVRASSIKFVIRALLLIGVTTSIAYTKCLAVLEYFPIGWNYLALALLIVPFAALSLSSSKLCAYVHAFDHGFGMLDKQAQLMVQELNSNERRTNFIVSHHHGHQGPTPPPPCLQVYRKQRLMFELQQSLFRIRSKHDAMCLLVERFFGQWGFYMLLFLSMYVCLFVIEAFFLFTNVYGSLRSGTEVDGRYAWMNLRACLLVVIELTWTIGSCSGLIDSVQRIGVTLNTLVLLDVDAGLAQAIETWTIKLLCQPNAVQVFRLFDINNGLLYSVSGQSVVEGEVQVIVLLSGVRLLWSSISPHPYGVDGWMDGIDSEWWLWACPSL